MKFISTIVHFVQFNFILKCFVIISENKNILQLSNTKLYKKYLYINELKFTKINYEKSNIFKYLVNFIPKLNTIL